MPKHEEYEALCALAVIGEASASELSELKKHLDACAACRCDYKEFAEFVLPQLSVPDDSLREILQGTGEHDGPAIRGRFLKEKQMAGVSLSPEALNLELHLVAGTSSKRRYYLVAAASVIVAAACGYYAGVVRTDAAPTGTATAPMAHVAAAPPVTPQPQAAAHNVEDTNKVASLELELREISAQLEKEQTKATSVESERGVLQEQIKALQQQVAAADLQGQASKQAIAELRAQLDRSQEQAKLDQASFVADEVKIKILNDQLEEQKASVEHAREILSAGHEVGDLMAERNLHIVDVYDTDGEGKTKPIFGRIFLTGNKRLVFYAYDLNESRIEHAKYTYRVWGEKQGPGESAKALGVFNADDKTQKRWVFKYEDPKVLSQIDSVFVTFEPTAKSPDHPRGQKLMYAYLRGEVNHP